MPLKIYRPLGRSNVFGFKVKNHSDFKYTLKMLDNGLSKNRVFFNPKKKEFSIKYYKPKIYLIDRFL